MVRGALAALLIGVAGCSAAGCSAAVPVPQFEATPTYEIPPPADVPVAVADPTHVSIPKIGAESSLVHVGLVDGEIDIPPATDPLQAAWWNGSPRPGEVGPAAILGHVDGQIDGRRGQPGIFHQLHTLVPGDEVLVQRDDGSTVRFAVYTVERVDKDAFPNDRVYGNTDEPELRLITCGGRFNRNAGHYEDNVIAYARIT